MRTITMTLTLLALANLSGVAGAQTYGPATDVSFKADLDGTTQYYMQLLPTDFDPEQTHDLIFTLHGCGATRDWYVSGPNPHAIVTRETAAKHGMILISPDYRANTSWMGPAAEADMVQMIRDLRAKYRIGKVYVMGNSMGGSGALTFAVLHPDLVDGVAAFIPCANFLEYRSFSECIVPSFGGTKEQIPLEYKKRSAEYWPEKFTMPVAIVTGADDDVVPPGSANRLADVLRQIGRPVWSVCREGLGHVCTNEDTVTALEFVSNYVKPAASKEPAK